MKRRLLKIGCCFAAIACTFSLIGEPVISIRNGVKIEMVSSSVEAATYGDFTYNKIVNTVSDYDGKISITAYNGTASKVVVPSEIDGLPVVEVFGLVRNNSTVTEVVLPDSVRRIEAYTFRSCPNLTKVTLPTNLAYVSRLAVYDCTKLNLAIPSNLTLLSNGDYQKAVDVSISGRRDYDLAREAIDLINARRAQLGLNALAIDETTMEEAMKRAEELYVMYDHMRPNGLLPQSISALGTNYGAENIGITSRMLAEDITNGWFNSAGHYYQICKSQHTSTGLGCFIGDNGLVYWCNIFSTGPSSSTNTKTGRISVTRKVQVATDKGYIKFNIAGVNENNTIKLGESLTPTRINNINYENDWAYTYLSTSDATWTSSNKNVASVDANGKVTAVGYGDAVITATLGEVSKSFNVNVPAKPLESISIEPSAVLKLYDEYQLNVTFNPEDTTDDKTIRWSSSDDDIVDVDEDGLIYGCSEGTATITATASNGMTATCEVTVVDITTNPAYYQFDNLDTTFTANLKRYKLNLANISWKSTNINVATVNSSGVVTPKVGGFTYIVGTHSKYGDYMIPVYVNVPVTLSDGSKGFVGDIDRDGALNIVDASSIRNIVSGGKPTANDLILADIDGNGKVETADSDMLTQMLTLGNFRVGPYKPVTTVNMDATATIAIGKTSKLYATLSPADTTDKQTITWSSSNSNKVSITSDGTIKGLAVGTSTITATAANGVSSSCVVTVVDISAGSSYYEFQNKGLTHTFSLKLAGEKLQDVTWKSNDPNIVSVTNEGVATSVNGGFATLTATSKEYGSRSILVYVNSPIETSDKAKWFIGDINRDGNVDATDASMILNIASGNPTQDQVKYADLNKSGTVDATDASILLDYVRQGIFTAGPYKRIEFVTLNKDYEEVEEGKEVKLVASINPTDTTDSPNLTWITSNEKIATVDGNGKVTAIAPGDATITVTTSNGKQAFFDITVIKKQSETYLKGDLNRDGKTNSSDAALILELYQNGLATELDLVIGDMNDDEKINSSDAAIVLEWFQTGYVKYITL